MSDTGTLDAFRDVLGEGGVLATADLTERYLVDQRALLRGETAAVLRPRTPEEVQATVRLARQHGYGLVPQAGNTSYVGGATPDLSGRQLVVSLERMT
ncbi:MAG: FAD-binding oxidoreductase, partial [Rhizobiales bacterium 12-68-15]